MALDPVDGVLTRRVEACSTASKRYVPSQPPPSHFVLEVGGQLISNFHLFPSLALLTSHRLLFSPCVLDKWGLIANYC